MNNSTRLIVVGGFLGAGKTTLLFETTKRFIKEGKQVGLVTNDQASELVDTVWLLQTEAEVSEVSGSCFCCNYEGFVESINQFKRISCADIIIAESVGSCTDLSATIMQPLKDNLNGDFTISPLTVLADPLRLTDLLEGRTGDFHQSTEYILRKQLEESDIIVISKADLLESNQLEILKEKVRLQFPNRIVLSISSITGEGIAEWIKIVSESTQIGNRIIEVDYDVYAEGEAMLGWLNASITFTGNQVKWDQLITIFLSELGKKFDSLGIGVGHVKVILENGENHLLGNITGKSDTIDFRGKASVSDQARMILNARVGTAPDNLDQLVKVVLDRVIGSEIKMKINTWKCLSPGYPEPTFRYEKVINMK